MKKPILYLLVSAIVFTSCSKAQTLDPKGPLWKAREHEWRISLKVIDEDGLPLANAKTGIGYFSNSVPASKDGITDTNGFFSASQSVTASMVGYDFGIDAQKSGYYATRKQFHLDAAYDPKKWSPTVDLILRKIGHPIPMYAKNEEAKIPKENEPIGFDLMDGDWVAPYGNGKNTDVFFTIKRKILSGHAFEADVKVTFPNKGDGITVTSAEPDTGSMFKTERTAAADGYETERILQYSNLNKPDPVFGYSFRVRTVLDENGTVKSALYGKIAGDFTFYAGTKTPKAGIGFDYYLNPTPNDRNVEFDPKQNLFKGLPFDHLIRNP